MKKESLRIKIILGSTRPNRFSEYPGRWVTGLIEKREDVDVELLDLRDYQMPFFSEPVSPSSKKEPYKNEAVVRWTKKIGEADGFIIIAPEYNRGTSGILKNAFDYVFDEWANKPISFVSYGTAGGARAIEHLNQVAMELQMIPVRNAVRILAQWDLRGEGGIVKEGAFEQYERAANTMIERLLWLARTLKEAHKHK